MIWKGCREMGGKNSKGRKVGRGEGKEGAEKEG